MLPTKTSSASGMGVLLGFGSAGCEGEGNFAIVSGFGVATVNDEALGGTMDEEKEEDMLVGEDDGVDDAKVVVDGDSVEITVGGAEGKSSGVEVGLQKIVLVLVLVIVMMTFSAEGRIGSRRIPSRSSVTDGSSTEPKLEGVTKPSAILGRRALCIAVVYEQAGMRVPAKRCSVFEQPISQPHRPFVAHRNARRPYPSPSVARAAASESALSDGMHLSRRVTQEHLLLSALGRSRYRKELARPYIPEQRKPVSAAAPIVCQPIHLVFPIVLAAAIPMANEEPTSVVPRLCVQLECGVHRDALQSSDALVVAYTVESVFGYTPSTDDPQLV
ncbi:hypothetical protein NUW54_g12306 [Trametes sanguinea]|uniref:Uncharacterized protein n=1 Tax=Trametes sanguinea TaxID=158606 RepID=A0ACC1MZ35_9APHY|nr:hypothetical protein NUW54_g12306 [Trametes sanguinea]